MILNPILFLAAIWLLGVFLATLWSMGIVYNKQYFINGDDVFACVRVGTIWPVLLVAFVIDDALGALEKARRYLS